MPKFSRRDILASFAATAALAASPAFSAACDVRRARSGGVSTKSYDCQLGDGRRLKTTFMRVSDVFADPVGQSARLNGLGDYETMLKTNQLIQNPTLNRFQSLLEQFSYPFESNQLEVVFDGRGSGNDASRNEILDTNARFRTLGVWDGSYNPLPLFPLPDVLRSAMVNKNVVNDMTFLRYATEEDFEDLEAKLEQYLAIWKTGFTDPVGLRRLGNLNLLRHIRAASMDKFLPLYFSNAWQDGCGGDLHGGANYSPPALFVDLAICRNEGTKPIEIEDFFGAADMTPGLRKYNSTTPPESMRFGWDRVRLNPNESAISTQRLLFGILPDSIPFHAKQIAPDRAVFGETQLPKGVIVGQQAFPFEGRSHNALVIGSYNERGSCPFLMSWCNEALEWVLLGKVIVDNVGREAAGEDMRRFIGLRKRFKLFEREHERSTIQRLALTLELADGTIRELVQPGAEIIIDIGQGHTFEFTLPEGLDPKDVIASTLHITGYYEKYVARHLEERREALCLTS